MATSDRAFRIELYNEHLEEGGFLYGQRRKLLSNPEISWRDVRQCEDRLEAHIDALVIGDELALDVCRARAKDGEPSESFSAFSVFCRQRRADLVSEFLGSLDFGNPDQVLPAEDALKYELPHEWTTYYERALLQSREGATRMLARVAGYRRLAVSQQIAQALPSAPTGALASLVWALGRLGTAVDPHGLVGCLNNENVAIKSATLLALIRLGQRELIEKCQLVAVKEPWTHTGLGLGGARSTSRVLGEAARSGQATSECLFALGLLGDLSAVRALHDCLAKPDLAASAALALNLITGARLYEEVFVTDDVVEDELFEEELRAWRERGQAPAHPDGRPFGTTVRRLTQSPEKWREWLLAHSKEFEANKRYRNGKPYSPGTLLKSLIDGSSTAQVRQVAAEELVIRYGCPVPFEADMPVTWQLRALRDIGAWIESHGSRFEAGEWYFAGQPC